jgi:hypothetical protein
MQVFQLLLLRNNKMVKKIIKSKVKRKVKCYTKTHLFLGKKHKCILYDS